MKGMFKILSYQNMTNKDYNMCLLRISIKIDCEVGLYNIKKEVKK